MGKKPYLALTAITLIRETPYFPSGVEEVRHTFEEAVCNTVHLLFLVTYPYLEDKNSGREKYSKENILFLLFLLPLSDNFTPGEFQGWPAILSTTLTSGGLLWTIRCSVLFSCSCGPELLVK